LDFFGPPVLQRAAAQASAARVSPPDQRTHWLAAVLAQLMVLRQQARCEMLYGMGLTSAPAATVVLLYKSLWPWFSIFNAFTVQRYCVILNEWAQRHGEAATHNQSYAYPMRLFFYTYFWLGKCLDHFNMLSIHVDDDCL